MTTFGGASPSPFGRPPAPGAPTTPPQPTQLGRYVLQGELGRGGMGVVYRAHDPSLDRPVAVKVLTLGPSARPDDAERFVREARLAGKLRHPGIVSPIDVGQQDNALYIVMPLVAGRTLSAFLKDEADLRRRVEVVRDVARALHHAHESRIVHRDVKPSNVMIDDEGHTLLMDFGLARDDDASRQITTTGQTIGTPAFMAPEQVDATLAELGPGVDVYGLGVVLFLALTGRIPFDDPSTATVFKRILLDDPPDPTEVAPEVPPPLGAVALRCLEKDPPDRYPSAAALADDLDRWLAGETPKTTRRSERARPPTARGPAMAPIPPTGVIAALAAGIVLLGIAAVALGLFGDGGDPDPIDPPVIAAGDEGATATATAEGPEPDASDDDDDDPDAATPPPPALEPWWEPAPEQREYAEASGLPLCFENELGMRFVLIPPGTFVMGSRPSERSRFLPFSYSHMSERRHRVTLSRPFYLGATEVTFGQLRRRWPGHAGDDAIEESQRTMAARGQVLRGDPSMMIAADDDRPVVLVSATKAEKFADWLSEQPDGGGRHYRLPTSAEWERAARAGTETIFPWGDDPAASTTRANVRAASDGIVSSEDTGIHFPRNDRYRVSTPVGTFAPNRFGLFDVIGNAAEWTSDAPAILPWFPVVDPAVPTEGSRAIRGGSYASGPLSARSGAQSAEFNEPRPHVGFRLVCEIDRTDLPNAPDVPEGRTMPLPDGVAPADAELVPDGTWWTPTPEQLDAARGRGWPLWFESEIGRGLRFVLVPAGRFSFGLSPEVIARFGIERADGIRQNDGMITAPVYLAATETTQAQFRFWRDDDRLQGADPFVGADRPMVSVPMPEAEEHGRWLATEDGDPGRYRLPKRLEWERGLRAGSRSAWFWGEDEREAALFANLLDPSTILPDRPRPRWAKGEPFPLGDGLTFPGPVASYDPNRLGLFDMTGNVAELHAAKIDPSVPEGFWPTTGSSFADGRATSVVQDARSRGQQADLQVGFRLVATRPPRR